VRSDGTAIAQRPEGRAYGLYWLFVVPAGLSRRRGEHWRRDAPGASEWNDLSWCG